MALFLRGRTWWMEYRTRSVRKVMSTGFKREQLAEARAAYQAFRLGMGTKPKRSAMEGILSAIYGASNGEVSGIPLDTAWSIYDDWCRGKNRTMTKMTYTNRRNRVASFVGWAAERGCYDVSDISVQTAREYVAHMVRGGLSNKSVRTYSQYLSSVWEAVGQLRPGVHNPWKAAMPDNDGSSIRHEAFDDGQIRAVMDAADRIGHGWRLASVIALYTGLRYGDVATLVWGSERDTPKNRHLDNGVVDIERGVIIVDPNKTSHSSRVRVLLPIAPALRKELKGGGYGEFVIPEHGLNYGHKQVDPPFSSVLAAAGITGSEYGFHSWRHTANSRMAEAGVSSEIRQMICGWTSGAMAKHYDHSRRLPQLTEAVGRI